MGKWKNFFVKQMQLAIETMNPSIQMEEGQRGIIKNVLSNVVKKERLQPQYPIYYDAWEHDSDADPILSLIYSITEAYDYFNVLGVQDKKNGINCWP